MENTDKDYIENNIVQMNVKLDKCENIIDTNKNIVDTNKKIIDINKNINEFPPKCDYN